MLAQSQHNCQKSKAYMLGLCIFEGHILKDIFCLRITSPAMSHIVLQSGLAEGRKVGNAVILKYAVTAKLTF